MDEADRQICRVQPSAKHHPGQRSDTRQQGSPCVSKTGRFALTGRTMAYLGEGIAQIATRDPISIKGKHYSLVEYWTTGSEFVDVFTRVNGAKPTIKDLSDEELETMRVTPPMGPVAAAYLTAWATNKWNYKDPQEVEGWKSKSLEEVAAVWKQ